mmetsp:Transcript_28115/g.70566  ORF Transcript_28115/g.70566 Transcript_28115/m.70566 type:complete len:207 (-) Transcript_28115:456-1076(-)
MPSPPPPDFATASAHSTSPHSAANSSTPFTRPPLGPSPPSLSSLSSPSKPPLRCHPRIKNTAPPPDHHPPRRKTYPRINMPSSRFFPAGSGTAHARQAPRRMVLWWTRWTPRSKGGAEHRTDRRVPCARPWCNPRRHSRGISPGPISARAHCTAKNARPPPRSQRRRTPSQKLSPRSKPSRRTGSARTPRRSGATSAGRGWVRRAI